MNPIVLKIASAGVLFLFIFLTGFWLSRSGKPYNGIPFNIHKLIGLAVFIYLVMTAYRIHHTVSLGRIEITAVAVTVLFFAGTIAAGGLVSIPKPMPAAISMLHKLFPYLTVLSTCGTLYLLYSHGLQ